MVLNVKLEVLAGDIGKGCKHSRHVRKRLAYAVSVEVKRVFENVVIISDVVVGISSKAQRLSSGCLGGHGGHHTHSIWTVEPQEHEPCPTHHCQGYKQADTFPTTFPHEDLSGVVVPRATRHLHTLFSTQGRRFSIHILQEGFYLICLDLAVFVSHINSTGSISREHINMHTNIYTTVTSYHHGITVASSSCLDIMNDIEISLC